jgi:hypothetical protein
VGLGQIARAAATTLTICRWTVDLPSDTQNLTVLIEKPAILGVSYVTSVSTREQLLIRLERIFRCTVALCFIGHGFWGVVSKPAWIGLITPMGFSESFAIVAIPIVGWLDIVLGVLIMVQNNKAWLWKALTWTVFTACLRPLAGMSFFEIPERAGNFGIPLAFLVLIAFVGKPQTFFGKISIDNFNSELFTDQKIDVMKKILQWSVGLLLIGHGGLVAFAQKTMYVDHLSVLAITGTSQVLILIGWFEIALGIYTVIKPSIPLIWFILIWKCFTEALYPFAGSAIDVFETIERWGDYGGPVALLLILYFLRSNPKAVVSDDATRSRFASSSSV